MVFFKHDPNGDLMIIVIHVDDCTITASMMTLVTKLKDGMKDHVEVMDLGGVTLVIRD